MSDMEHILKYMKGTFPEVKSKLFDTIAEGKFERLVNWHKNTLKPRCDSLINLQFLSTSNDEDKQKDIEKDLKKGKDVAKDQEKLNGSFSKLDESQKKLDENRKKLLKKMK